MLFDSHAHVNFKPFEKDQNAVIKRALDAGISMINVGSQLSTSRRAVEIAEEYEEGVYAAIGLHPIHLEDQIYKDKIDSEEIEFRTRAEKFDITAYRELGKNKKVVAFGETGFDFYHIQDKDKKKIISLQEEALNRHLALAKELDKPVILHCRDAYAELLDFLSKNGQKIKGVLHCYSGTKEQAKEFLNLGLYLGFTGIITFKNKKLDELRSIVKETPLDKILVETDCPYLTPEPHRGTRNEPLYVRFVAQKVAEIKGITLALVEEQTTKNVKKLFNI
ncbi:MAG: TatD family hydrolase [Patescibacteria group bacterium]|jgi:TatD DNase family protein